MPQQPKPWEPGATTRQRVAPLVAAVIVVAAVVYALLPFTFAGVVRCSPALTGSSADPDTPAGIVVGNHDEACAAMGGTRLVNAGVVAVAAIVIGVAGAFLPSERPPSEGEVEGGDGDAEGGAAKGPTQNSLDPPGVVDLPGSPQDRSSGSAPDPNGGGTGSPRS